jgi:hypothetical protein
MRNFGGWKKKEGDESDAIGCVFSLSLLD